MSGNGSLGTKQKIKDSFVQLEACNLSGECFEKLGEYLDLLIRWNARLNLTAVRDVDEMIRIHLLECAFAALHLPVDVETLLDYGSGAGLPGIVIAACRPEIRVTLADSNSKKASFLREAVRSMGVDANVFSGRVDALSSAHPFDAVSLRAVEKMEEAVPIALGYTKRYLLLLTTYQAAPKFAQIGSGLTWLDPIPVPLSKQRVALIGTKPPPVDLPRDSPKATVPRGTLTT